MTVPADTSRRHDASRFAAQLALYGALMALVGYASTEPPFSTIAPDEALLRISFIHAAERRSPCRERSAEELARLAPNMRAAQECPRERADLLVEVDLDGHNVLRREVAPTGLHRDGNAVVYQRMALPAGSHRIAARLRDRPGEGFTHEAERTVLLARGDSMVIDFNAVQGGFVFHLPAKRSTP